MIRYADENDFEIVRIYDRHIREEELQNVIRARRVLVMFQEDSFVGWLRFSLFWDEIPFMNMLYFLEQYRGRGYGGQLVKYWEKEMKSSGYEMVMTPTLSNEPAQFFYRKKGYMDCGSLLLSGVPLEIILKKSL